jgi:hypothetical protein
VGRQSTSTRIQAGGGGNRGLVGLLGVAALLGAVVYVGPQFGVEIPVLTEMVHGQKKTAAAVVQLNGKDKGVEVMVNGEVIATELPATVKGVAPGAPVAIVVQGAAGTFRQIVNLNAGETRNIEVVLTGGAPVNTAGTQDGRLVRTGLVRIVSNPAVEAGNATVTVNGKPMDLSKGAITVNLDEHIEMVVVRQGYKPFRTEFVVKPADVAGGKEFVRNIVLEPLKFGYVTIRSTPSADAVISPRDAGGGVRTPSSDLKPITLKTPIEGEKFPIGTYQVRLVNEVLGMEKNLTITVQEGKAVNIDERLQIRN